MNKFTRREFIGGAASVAFAPVAFAADIGLSFKRDRDDVIVQIAGSDAWTIRPKLIAPFASVVEAGPTKLRIVGGELPSGLGFEVQLDFVNLHGAWGATAEWLFRSISLKAKSKTVEVSKNPIRFSTNIADAKRLIGHKTRSYLQLPAKASLRLDEHFQTSLDAGGNRFSVLGGKLSSRRLLLSQLPEDIDAAFVSEAPATEIGLGSREAVQTSLWPHGKVTVQLGSRGLALHGSLDLLVRKSAAATAKISCEEAILVHKGTDSSWQLKPAASFGYLKTRGASFDLNAEGSHRPIELTSNNRGRLSHFLADLNIWSSTIAVAGADRTRFDINGQRVRVELFASVMAQGDLPAPPTRIILSDPSVPIRLNLDNAALRVWRGCDLFSLTFRFHKIELELGERITLVPRKDPEPLLIAEFPPQHIMERTFLRQYRALPDAGAEITPADLRQLQRGGATADMIRTRLQAGKILAESEDIPQSDYRPFVKFSEEWRTKYAKAYGEWVGPAGLFTVEQRRKARQLLEELRLGRLNKLLPVTTFSDADFASAVDVLAMPAFPMTPAEARAWLVKNPRGQRPKKEDGTTATDLEALLEEAGARVEEFASFQKASRTKVQLPLLLPAWPFTDKDYADIFLRSPAGATPDPPPKQIPAPRMHELVHKLLEEEQLGQSETRPADRTREQVPEGFRRPVEAWISGPSRLAFVIDTTKTKSIDLNVEKLTAWESFELRVIRRAMRLQAPLDSEPAKVLEEHGIRPGVTSGQERMKLVREAMKSGPTLLETALEVPTNLILSPAQDARWITPKPSPEYWRTDEEPTPVWQARMHESQKVPSLRAVWSRDLEPKMAREPREPEPFEKIFNPEFRDAFPERWKAPNDQIYRTAMGPLDRVELVALSSMYGLPVIASEDKDKSSQIATPPSYRIDDVDAPTAIYMPVPLKTRRLALGATGAMLDLDTTFPAPTSVRARGKPLFDSPSIGRVRFLVNDGSDVVTTVVRRGYLFPLCHKASLIKVTEPRLRAIDPKRPSLGYTVEQATRIYIEVTRASHQYPAVGQLDEGREFQPHNVTLLTTRTPDLIDPADDRPPPPLRPNLPAPELKKELDEGVLTAGPYGSVRGWIDQGDDKTGPVPGRMAGKVFWPRTERGTKGTVRFRMRVDDGSAPVSAPLLFVDHTAASDPETMRAVCRYYNGGKGGDGDKPKDWNVVRHNGALRTYADEKRQGECTFATDWQRIEATGGSTEFTMDPALIAAEQPPFYPRMALAQIRPQQIQGLTGSEAPALQVAYVCDYVTYGFNPPSSANIEDPDTYLLVTNDPKPKLDMGANGDKGGTVARKAMEICGLNRRFGLSGPPLRNACAPRLGVGVSAAPTPTRTPSAPAISTPTPTPSPASTPTPAPDSPAPPATTEVLAPPLLLQACDAPDKVEHTQYSKLLSVGHFGDDCTLFGLIRLSTFIEAIAGPISSECLPKLDEINSFAGEVLSQVVSKIAGPVRTLRDQFTELKGDLIFPDFAVALNDLHCELGKASVPNLPPSQEVQIATKIWSSGQRVARELDTIARTPVAEIATRLRAYLIHSQGAISGELRSFTPWLKLRDQLAKLIVDSAEELPAGIVTIALNSIDAELLENVTNSIKQQETWLTADPLKTIRDAAKAKFPTRTDLDQVIVKGLLYDLAVDFLKVLQEDLDRQFGTATVSAAVAWAERGIAQAEELRGRIKRLVDQATADCNRVIGTLSTTLAATVPALPLQERAGIVTGIRQAAEEVGVLRERIENAAPRPLVEPMLNYLAAWIGILNASANTLVGALAAMADARARVVTALNANRSCGSFNIDVARLIAALHVEQQKLVTAWLSAARLPAPPPSAPQLPALGTLWQEVHVKIADTLKKIVSEALGSTFLNALSRGSAQWAATRSAFDGLSAQLPELGAAFAEAQKAIDDQQRALANAIALLPSPSQDIAGLNAQATALLNAAGDIEKALREPATKLFESALRVAIKQLLGEVEKKLDGYAKPVLDGIGSIYEGIAKARDAAYQVVKGRLDVGGLTLVKRLFGPPPADGCQEDWGHYLFYVVPEGAVCEIAPDGRVTNDLILAERRRASAGTTEALKEILAKWKNGEAAPQKLVRHVEYFAKFGVRASVLKVFDVENLRRQIAESLSQAVPTKRTLSSTLNLPLSTTSVGLGTFRPIGSGTLALTTSATVDLLNPGFAPRATFKGKVSPFELDILSIMTFRFKDGVTYDKPEGDNRGDIIAPLGAEDIKFGDKLSFLADLSRSLRFGSDDGEDGPYTIVHVDSPSIEAGYRISIPVITLGVTFTNIHFAGAVMLPFSSGAARLRAALGSLNAPFMISAGIYGGSGFMGIECSAKGIELFEASFEFGGIASLGYGPLQGTAYVTTGAYVRKDRLGCTFAALFSAGFTAHIACFGISAAFTLRLYKRDGDSSIQGEAQLTFTFSVGFAKVHYTIRVARTMQAGFGGGGQQAAENLLPGRRIRLAALGGFTPDCYPIEQAATLNTKSSNPEEAWSEFEAQFDQQFYPSFAA